MGDKGVGLFRKAHFLGAKLRALRKRHHLTLEDLSVRCMQVDRERAPSVSYLSMIENGKRTPSNELLELFATVFQKEPEWFLDDGQKIEAKEPDERGGGIAGIPLEPWFLFSRDLLQTAIPELLAQTGTTGREFAHVLIRAYQESHQNRFPDLERAAEEVGQRRFPLAVEDLMDLCRKLDLEIRWFDRAPAAAPGDDGAGEVKTLVRSSFETPRTIHLNERLRDVPARLKYDLASHIGHRVLHSGDGRRSAPAAGAPAGSVPTDRSGTPRMASADLLEAWRDFECSFFAGALLCPKQPFRQLLQRHAHDPSISERVELTPSVVMRRMTAVSPYPHWHYFDAYPPGRLRAVYRANGIPLPWGNMRLVQDPCPHWAVFRMLERRTKRPYAQISVLLDEERQARLYSCESLRTQDAAGNWHVICAGVDLSPALETQGFDPHETADLVAEACHCTTGAAEIPEVAAQRVEAVGKVLNIGWIADGLTAPASMICPRSSACPRPKHCLGAAARRRQHRREGLGDEILQLHGPA